MLLLFLVNGRLNLSHILQDPVLLILIILFLQSRVRTVQRWSLHGCFLSDFTLGTVRRVLEGIANFTEVKGSKVTVAFVIPFWSASSEKKRKINVSKKKINMKVKQKVLLRTLYPLWKGAWSVIYHYRKVRWDSEMLKQYHVFHQAWQEHPDVPRTFLR